MDGMEDYRVTDAEQIDEKGRPAVKLMSDRELLEEIALGFRAGFDAMEQAGQNPMVKMALGL